MARNFFRLFGIALAFAMLLAALRIPFFRNAEGLENGRFILVLAASAAVILLSWSSGTAWRNVIFWFVLAIVAQAISLQLIDAGSFLHYQHYRLIPELLRDAPSRVYLAILSAHAVLVLFGVIRRWPGLKQWVAGRFGWVRLAGALLAAGATGAAVSRDPHYFLGELCLAAAIQTFAALNVLLIACSFPTGALKSLARRFDAFLGNPEQLKRARIDRFAAIAALWATLVCGALAWSVYERHPHLADEVAYLYNARYFASGHLTMPPPPVQSAFAVDLMDYQPDKWVSAVPLGWPAALAVGTLLGIPWLVNPVLAGVNILLVYLLLWEICDRRLARISVLLLCFSPWNLFMGMSFMTHMWTTTCALLAFLGIAWARRTRQGRWALLAGAATGFGSLIRPLDGVIVALLAGLWILASRLSIRIIASFAAGCLLLGSINLPYNKLLTGNPLKSPLVSYQDKTFSPDSNAYGFGPDRGLGWALDAYPGHTPFEALINAELNLASVNVELFGWSTGSLVLAIIGLLCGRRKRGDWLMIAAILVVILAYAPYWFSGGPDFGARYWFLILIPCVVLTVRGIEALVDDAPPLDQMRVLLPVLGLCLMAALNYFPWRALDKYHHYLRMRPDVVRLAEQHKFGRSLVLIRGSEFPDYASAAIYNPLDLHSNNPIYVWDRNASVRDQVVSVYRDRPVWIIEGPSITKAGFRIVAGPLQPRSLSQLNFAGIQNAALK